MNDEQDRTKRRRLRQTAAPPAAVLKLKDNFEDDRDHPAGATCANDLVLLSQKVRDRDENP
jgi:hypothetical protein